MKDPLWEGVYKSFAEVPVKGSGFSGSDWLQNSAAKLAQFKAQASTENTIPTVTAYGDSLLPVIAGIVAGQQHAVRILDFGGGLGFSYYQIKEALASTDRFELHVIDIEAVCDEGRRHFQDEPNISFHTAAAEIEDQNFDIVHIGSSLQYVENWQQQLSALCSLNPRYLLMANIPAGDIDTFATAQNYYGSRIACWFFNVRDLIDSMQAQEFQLIFKSSYSTKVYGIEQPYPLENFEAQYRVKYPCMLLFQNQSK